MKRNKEIYGESIWPEPKSMSIDFGESAELDSSVVESSGPVTVLGMTFSNDEERRQHFREELRKKLPELRKIEGFPIGDDEDIINLSDPPFYTACPNPWLNDFIAEWEEEKKRLEAEGKRKNDFEVTEPYASDVSEGKNNPVYNAHSYYTKVPHPAIMRYILHYTQPGDIIFDGFAGTGMTGVAASLCGNPPTDIKTKFENDVNLKGFTWGIRHSICGDLSPLASFLASNFNTRSISQFERSARELMSDYAKAIGDLYTVVYKGKKCEVSYILYSDVFICPNCQSEVNYLGGIFSLSDSDASNNAKCPHCGASLKKADERVYETFFDEVNNIVRKKKKSIPLVVGLKYNKKIIEVPISELDTDYSDKLSKIIISKWYPTDRFPEGNEGRRNDKTGLLYINDLYSKENLYATSELYDLIKDNSFFKFAFLNTSWHATIMRRYNTGGGHRPKTGTLYVPSISSVGNVQKIYKNKLSQLKSFLNYIGSKNDTAIIQTASCTHSNLPANSVDYIFTDPPFGANIAYSELNSIWESWLKVRTQSSYEAIENPSVGKTIEFYGKLMYQSLLEYYRILKPGKWMTIEFSNTSNAIWNIITMCVQNSGFVIGNVSALDKKQGSISAYTTTTAVQQDLVISCYKPSRSLLEKFEMSAGSVENAWDFIDEHISHLPVHIEKDNQTTTVVERSPKILYDRLISYYVQHGYPVPMDARQFQEGLRERYLEQDGMFFNATQAAEYEQKRKNTTGFVPMGIIVSDEANGIEWLRNLLRTTPKTYQEIQPDWMQAINGVRKNDILPELRDILDENFIEEPDGKWRLPNIQDDVDKTALRTKALLREFRKYVEKAQMPKSNITEARVEALRAGFKQCYIDKDFATTVMVAEKIPQNLLHEDGVLLQHYAIALKKVQ